MRATNHLRVCGAKKKKEARLKRSIPHVPVCGAAAHLSGEPVSPLPAQVLKWCLMSHFPFHALQFNNYTLRQQTHTAVLVTIMQKPLTAPYFGNSWSIIMEYNISYTWGLSQYTDWYFEWKRISKDFQQVFRTQKTKTLSNLLHSHASLKEGDTFRDMRR